MAITSVLYRIRWNGEAGEAEMPPDVILLTVIKPVIIYK
jgi:hypothetical protein